MVDRTNSEQIETTEVAPVATSEDRIALYEQVVDNAELLGVQLQHSEFNVDQAYFSNNDQKRVFSYGVAEGEIAYSVEHGFATIEIAADVTVRLGKKRVLTCKAKYDVLYRGLEGCDEDAVNGFLRRVGRFTCYPYFRSLVAHLDASAGTRLPTLPVLREQVLPSKRKKLSKTPTDASDEA